MESGLQRGAVGFWQLTYQSISLVSPAGAMAATMTGAASYAQGALPLTYVFSVIAAAFMINTTYQFSQRIASAGGFYAYVSQGMNAKWGIVAGLLFLLSYFMVFTNAALFLSGVFIPGILSELLHITLPSWSWVVLMIMFDGIVLYFAYAGIQPSLKYSVWTGAFEILILVIASVAIIAGAGSQNTTEVFTNIHLAKNGINGIGVGVILAMFSMSGSSAAIVLGEETHSPRQTIRKAIITSFLFAASLFVLMAYAMTVGWGAEKMGSFASASIPGVILANRYVAPAFGWLLILFILNSLVAGSLAPVNGSVRMIYALARDGAIFPRSLAQVNARHNPTRAVLLVTGLGFLVSLIAGILLGPFNGFLVLVTASSVALFVGHIIANVALPIYFRHQRHLRVFAHLVAPTIASILVLLGIWYTIYPFPYPIVIGPLIVLAVIFYTLYQIKRIPPSVLVQAGQFNAHEQDDELPNTQDPTPI